MSISFDSTASPQLVTELCDKLANDDQFRQQFTADPHGTLKTHGVVLDSGVSVTLASKDKINTFLESLKSSPLSTNAEGVAKLNGALSDNLIFFG
jgi:putative modified peptide